MKTTLLFFGTLITSLSYGQSCSEIFISEYVEGWSTNKAMEFYNPTANTIDLSEYMVIRYSNGSTTVTSANAVQLTGSIAPNDVYVAVLEKLDPFGIDEEAPIWDSLQARADGYYCPDYNTSNAFYWNGNDAVVLAKGTIGDIPGSVLVDYIGKIGEDPGSGWSTDFPYTGAGVIVTENHSLIRKSTITQGVTDTGISYFIALDEYDSIPAVVDIGGTLYGNWFTLGSHTCDCLVGTDEVEATQNVSIYPNPSTGKFSVNGVANYNQLIVMNALGQTVTSISNNSKATVSFDLKAKRGLYFVKLKDNAGNAITKRVIIK